MYSLPRLDLMGNRPVRSDAVVPLRRCGRDSKAIKHSRVFTLGESDCGCMPSSAISSEAALDDDGSLALVDCKPWRSCLRWPFKDGTDGGRCFWIKDAVRPGQEWKFPFFIALMKPVLVGEKQQACRNCASSARFVSKRRTTLATGKDGVGVGLDKGTSQRPSVQLRLPQRMSWPSLL